MHASHDYSQTGLLLSLAASLPDPHSALARKAHRVARRLAKGARTHSLAREASDLLATLLTRADAGLALDDDGLLDGGFDD